MTTATDRWVARVQQIARHHPDWSLAECIQHLDDLTEEHDRDERDDR